MEVSKNIFTFVEENYQQYKCGSSSVGRASAFQAECRGFDPRLPLTEITISFDCDFFISRYSSAVERFLGKEEVSGSSPDNGSIK